MLAHVLLWRKCFFQKMAARAEKSSPFSPVFLGGIAHSGENGAKAAQTMPKFVLLRYRWGCVIIVYMYKSGK